MIEVRKQDECWEWKGNRHPKGYGSVPKKIRPEIMKDTQRANRITLSLKLGRRLKAGYCACHSCDNPSCCNPNHLWEGTVRENTQDASKKGLMSSGEKHSRIMKRTAARGSSHGLKKHPERAPRGERNGQSKFTSGIVTEIRRLYSTGEYTQKELARMFGTVQQTISDIVVKRRWRHLNG